MAARDGRKRRVGVGLPIELVVDHGQARMLIPIYGRGGAGLPCGLELPQRQVRPA